MIKKICCVIKGNRNRFMTNNKCKQKINNNNLQKIKIIHKFKELNNKISYHQ